ncbi:alpha/beta hydrolase [Streptomyces sp. NPDC046215]|uniref:alpha/beta hydrolase n=1 Tax=Streptomyces sp. NPDC046215 TaxID=3155774 RepID=UPI0033E38910
MFAFRKPRRAAATAVSAAVAAAVAAALLPAATAAARPAAGPPVPARYAAQKLAWQPCKEGTRLECAEMTVPRDWHHPGTGEDLRIAVSRVRASDPARRRGVLMTAAGGPGGQGLERPAHLASYAPSVAAAYDVAGFDQRGVGRSTRVRCRSDEEFRDFFAGDYRDRSPAALKSVVEKSRRFADSCRERSGDLLTRITTEQTVRDMDLYRALLGERKISYYGVSYATMIGAYYASLFPQRVERAVLDSNIAFGGTWEEFETGQPLSFQRRFEQDFLPWLARYDDVYHYGRTATEAKAKWEKLRSSLRDRPVPLPGGRVLDPNALDNAGIGAVYKGGNFPVLAGALAALDHWDTATPGEKKLADTVFGTYLSAEFFAEFLSVTCADTPWNRDIGYWVKRSGRDTATHPLAGARELAFSAACAAWPAAGTPRVEVTGKGLPPVLMLNSVRDPATHYEGAVRAHRALRGSRLVTVTGGDHGQYQSGNACVDGTIAAYLLEGTLPARDTTCEANPLPVPARPDVRKP